MKDIRSSFFLLLLSLVLFPSLTFATSEQQNWPVHLRILTSPVGGQWHTLGDRFARSISSTVPTSSRVGFGIKNITEVNCKSGDLAFTLSCFLKAAKTGDPQYDFIGPVDNVAILANLYPQILYIVLNKSFADEHNITSLDALLRLKYPVRFATLKPGSTSEFIVNLLLQYGYQTNFDTLRNMGWQITFSNFVDMADKLSADGLDCFAYTAGVQAPLLQNLANETSVVFLPVRKDALDILQKQFGTGTYTIKAGQYADLSHDITTLSDCACLIVRKDLPNDLVRTLTEILWANREFIGKGIADFQYLTPETAIPRDFPAHAGAVEAWNGLKKRP